VLGFACALDPIVLHDVRLLVSELVTNALRHGGLGPDDTIDLVLDIDAGEVHVEVRDPGPGFVPEAIPDDARPPEGRGWGLVFLRTIANRWGVDRDDGTRVWFELAATRDDARPSGNGRVRRARPHGRQSFRPREPGVSTN
jgi:anti-sigma regulatory factor (Ser/Thr protein kinase)